MPTAYKLLGEAVVGATRLSAAVSNKAITTNLATITTAANHGFSVGDIVVIAGVDTTFDGTHAIYTVPTTTTFTFVSTTATVASAAVTPNALVYRTHTLGGATVSNKYGTGANAIVTTGTAHGFAVNDWVRVEIGDANIDGLVKISGSPSTTLAAFARSGSSVASAAVTQGYVSRAIPSTWTQLYSVPASTSAVVSTLAVTNLTASAAQYRVAVSTTTTPTNAEIIVYDATVAANDTVSLTLGLTLPATEKIMVNANSNEISFSAFGSEVT